MGVTVAISCKVTWTTPAASWCVESCSQAAVREGACACGCQRSMRTVQEFRPDGDSLWVRIAVPPALIPFIVPKGYIAVDGTSLTVCEVHDGGSADASWFNLMLIAHTQRHIVLPRKAIGSRVNIEVDVMGKYAARAMAGVTAAMEATTASLTALVARVEGLERRLAAIESASSGVAAVSGSAAGAGAR